MKGSEITIQSIFNLFFWNFQNSSIQQFSNLYHSAVSILKFFNENGKYNSDLKTLKKMYFHPILQLKKKYKELNITKNPIDWDINKLEWCYFRDTRVRSKLATEYLIDSRKIQETKKITLGETITVLSLFKLEMFKIIIKILIDNKLNIYISLPSGSKEIEQLKTGDMV